MSKIASEYVSTLEKHFRDYWANKDVDKLW